jgi:large subunit ribosomal protein L33
MGSIVRANAEKERKIMAKKENRLQIWLKCTECNNLNYVTKKNVKNTTEKLEIKKYCNTCRKSTVHKENKINSGKK